MSRETGIAALECLRGLIACCPPGCLDRNPIQMYRERVTGDRLLYCPFAFGYSNYARPSFAPRQLRFGNLVTMNGERALRSTLGGAGLAISRRCTNRALAAEYVQFVASAECQRPVSKRGCVTGAYLSPSRRGSNDVMTRMDELRGIGAQ